MQLTEDRTYLDRICGALDYMLMTTGIDGLRIITVIIWQCCF